MKNISVSFGPPAQSGVQTIMGLGADELDALAGKTERALTTAGWVALGVWAVGLVTNKKQMRSAGLGGALVAWGVKYAVR